MVIGIDASRALVDQPTGTERYSWEVISRLAALPEAGGVDWVLYLRSGVAGFKLKEITRFPNVQVGEINWPRLWTQAGLAGRTWRDKLEVLWVPAHTLPVLRRPGLKTVVTVHGIEYEWLPAYENKLQRWYLPLSTKYAVATADKVIAVSEFTKRQLVERLGAAESKIQVIHEGCVTGIRKGLRGGGAEVLRKWGLEKDKYIIFVGTVQPRKNLGRLVEAFAMMRARNRKLGLKLVIAGKWGWEGQGLRARIANTEGVSLTGYISEAERYTLLDNALFYVQPSITEGFGLPVLEAWEAGLAVASSNGGALAEVCGQAGWMFDPYRVEEMAVVMERLAGDEGLRRELARRGRERLKDFSWDKAAEETFRLLVSL